MFPLLEIIYVDIGYVGLIVIIVVTIVIKLFKGGVFDTRFNNKISISRVLSKYYLIGRSLFSTL